MLQTAERGGRALADIAKARDARNLAGQHDVGRAADRIDQAFLAAIKIVELRLGDAVVHVDRREGQLAFLGQLVKAVDAGRRFFRHALDRVHALGEIARLGGKEFLERTDEFDFFGVGRLEQRFARFAARPPQREHRGVAAVIEDHVRGLIVAPVEDPADIVPIFSEALALHRKDGRAASGDRGGGMILGRKDVAGRPAHLGAQRDQRFDQHRGLDRHVQRSGDARALQRLRRAIFGAQRHQAGHFGFGDRDFLAAEVGEADVGNHIVGGAVLGLRRRDCGIGGGNGGIGCGGGHGEAGSQSNAAQARFVRRQSRGSAK